MTDDELHGAVVEWLAGILSVPVIRSHQSGSRPSLPYVMVNYTGSFAVREWAQGTDYSSSYPDPDPVTASPVIETEWRYSIHAYGQNPTGILRPVRSAAELTQVMEPLFPNVHLHEISQIRNVPDWVNERWEERAQIDVFVRGITRDGFIIDTIDDVAVSIQTKG